MYSPGEITHISGTLVNEIKFTWMQHGVELNHYRLRSLNPSLHSIGISVIKWPLTPQLSEIEHQLEIDFVSVALCYLHSSDWLASNRWMKTTTCSNNQWLCTGMTKSSHLFYPFLSIFLKFYFIFWSNLKIWTKNIFKLYKIVRTFIKKMRYLYVCQKKISNKLWKNDNWF